MASEVLRLCGVKRGDDETHLEALNRHSRQHRWRQDTYRTWRERVMDAVADEANGAFGSLARLNQWLRAFKLPEEKSLGDAHVSLQQNVYINIHDLVAGLLHRRCDSLAELQDYTTSHKMFYPLALAKDEGLRSFLHVMRGADPVNIRKPKGSAAAEPEADDDDDDAGQYDDQYDDGDGDNDDGDQYDDDDNNSEYDDGGDDDGLDAPATNEVFRVIGCPLDDDDDPIAVLQRFAEERNWRDDTYEKWLERVRDAMREDGIDQDNGDYDDPGVYSESAADVLRACGVVVQDDETQLQALANHSDEFGWRDDTYNKWRDRVIDAMREDGIDV